MHSETTMTRRQLLQQAGSVAAGAGAAFAIPTIIPASVLGAAGAPPPSERILVGHIGVGNQGRGNMSPHLKNTIAVCDVDRSRLDAAKERVEKATGGACATYADYRKLLENKDIGAVVISTPDHWHALQTIHACEAGKDVYCEKPLTLTISEGQAMVKAARRYGRIVQTGSQQRSDAQFRQACELVRNGRLGKVHTVRVGIPGVNFTGLWPFW